MQKYWFIYDMIDTTMSVLVTKLYIYL